MSFEYTSPNWKAGGVEPTDSLKQQGFKAGDKPPAAYFNWLFSRISACITELQNISTTLDERTNMMNGNDNKLSDYGIIDAYTKSACKNIFGLVKSFAFDKNYIPLSSSTSASIMTSTFQSEKLNTKYIFISSNVRIIQYYTFAEFVNLTDVYINNKESNITIESGAIPPTAKVHYVDDFNAVDFIMRALMSINDIAVNGIGDLNSLDTLNKNTVVAAINEIVENLQNVSNSAFSTIDGLSTCVGDVFELQTSNKTSTVAAINELALKIVNANYGVGKCGTGKNAEIFNDTSNTASNLNAHAEGRSTAATGKISHAEGYTTSANGSYSHSGGYFSIADGVASFAHGYRVIAKDYQSVFGRYNSQASAPKGIRDTTGSIFVVGCGTDNYQANALRIGAHGECYGATAFAAGGADYAEYFEWIDRNQHNEDRRGLFVALDGEKIRLANSTDEYILGVVSSTPAVCGDIQSENWKDMYLKDVFGNRMTEIVNVPESVDKTGQTIPAHTETQFIINPEYDPTRDYISREERQEWAAIGFIGKLVVVDDGTCQPNGYCKVTDNGTATNSTEKTAYRVLSRLDGNHIKILLK